MPRRPAVPIVMRLVMKIVENGSRANDIANKTQSAKKGSHAAKAIAQRLMILPAMADQLISTSATPPDRLPRESAGSPKASGSTRQASTSLQVEDKGAAYEDKQNTLFLAGIRIGLVGGGTWTGAGARRPTQTWSGAPEAGLLCRQMDE